MSISQEFIEYVCEQLRGLGAVTPKKMFGGAGLYHKGIFFGLIANDILFFKVDDSNKSDYTQKKCKPFQPKGHDSYVMSYYEVPVDVLEVRDELVLWAEKSYNIAKKARSKKGKNKKK